MRSILASVCAAGLMTAMAVPPLAAAPLIQAPVVEKNAVTDVQYRRFRDGDYRRGGDRDGWYRGHRGYRERRHGYRYHNGWWFPPAAFITGAIIGGAIASPPPPRRHVVGVDAHVQWCYDRYRSYREYDNSYQPYNGPRRQCLSPYG